jgi:hypothetical protein
VAGAREHVAVRNCIHHWIVEGESVTVDGAPVLPGRCRKCRKKRMFASRPPENFSLRTVPLGMPITYVPEHGKPEARMSDER